MPTSEPMAPGEVARLFVQFSQQLTGTDAKIDGIRTELNNKPSKQDFTDFKTDQIREHADQENRMRDIDTRQTAKNVEQDVAIKDVNGRTDKLLYGIIATAMTAAANMITNLAGG